MEVLIESLSYGGAGIGTIDGKKIFVKKAVPGDLVEIEITKDKKTFSEAVIKNIIKPSVHRVKPLCEYFDECGGCQWQNVEYETQLKEKEQILKDSLERIGRLPEMEIEPIEPSINEYGYRKRVNLAVWKSNEKFQYGYNKENSKEKVSINKCPIADILINNSLDFLSENINKLELNEVSIEKILCASGDNNTSTTFVSQNKISDFKKISGINADEKISSTVNEDNYFEFTVAGCKFHSLPSVFTQANDYINEKIVLYVSSFIESVNPRSVLDLYSGIGNFSLPISKFTKKVDGVEVNGTAVNLARENAKINNITNVYFHNERVETSLKRPQQKHYDLVLLDPPRIGAKDVIRRLIRLKPKHIIYVSCNPTTLARDLKELDTAGYKAIKIKPFDMFPQTFHIETVVVLSYHKF